MPKNIIENKWVEILVITIVISLFTILGITRFPILLLVIPAPFITYNIKTNILIGSLGFIAVSLVSGLVLDMSIALFLLISFLPFILGMSIYIKKGRKGLNLILMGTILLFISFFIFMIILNSMEEDLSVILESDMEGAITQQVEALIELEILGNNEKELTKLVTDIFNFIYGIIPGIFFIVSLITTYINSLIISLGLRDYKTKDIQIPKFRNMRVPNRTFLSLLLIIIIVFIMSKMGVEYVDVLSSNIGLILNFVVSIQGLAVLSDIMNRRNMFVVFRVFIYILIFSIPLGLIGVYMLGVLDVIFNFRKIKDE